jgi:hypothetical protein
LLGEESNLSKCRLFLLQRFIAADSQTKPRRLQRDSDTDNVGEREREKNDVEQQRVIKMEVCAFSCSWKVANVAARKSSGTRDCISGKLPATWGNRREKPHIGEQSTAGDCRKQRREKFLISESLTEEKRKRKRKRQIKKKKRRRRNSLTEER